MQTSRGAFTRAELVSTVAAISILATLVLPLLAGTRPDSDRAACFSNLRELGRGVRQWAGDHSEEPPWLTPTNEGGTRPNIGGKTTAAWAEYIVLSNELATARVLACPSDVGVKIARDWSGPMGLANSGFRQNAISYLLGLHANSQHPLAFVALDSNVQLTSPGPVGCSPSGIANAAAMNGLPFAPVEWTNAIHFSGGHYLAVDGSVRFLNSSALRAALAPPLSTDNGNHHLLRTR